MNKTTLRELVKSTREETDMLNELIFHLTADYRADNPEANAAFFAEYPEMKEIDKANKESK